MLIKSMDKPKHMNANSSCRWCCSSLNTNTDHRLCKAWKIWKLKDWVDKTEDMLLIMYNVIDFLEAQPA